MFSAAENLSAPFSDFENEPDGLQALSDDDTLENSASDGASNDDVAALNDDVTASNDDVDEDGEVTPEKTLHTRKVRTSRQTAKKLEEDVDPDWSPGYKFKIVKNKDQISNNIGENSNIDEEKKKRNQKYKKRPPKARYTCAECRESLYGKVAFNRHYRAVHGVKKANKSSYIIDEKRPPKACYTCEECGESLYGKVAFNKHHMAIHGVKKVKKSSSKKTTRVYYKRSDGPFTCEICGKVYNYISRLRRHQKRSHRTNQDRNFLCDTCGKAFLTADNLKNHVRLHSGQKFPCLHCHQVLNSRLSLYLHTKRRHLMVEAHVCPICNKTVSNKSSLKYHMLGQHGEECASQYNATYQYCDQCDKKYFSLADLKRHKLAVHDGKRWNCDQCDRVYSYKTAYDRHMRSVHGPPGTRFICEACSVEFVSLNAMSHHQRRRCRLFQTMSQKRYHKAHVIVQTNPLTMETTVVTQQSSNQVPDIKNATKGNHDDQSLADLQNAAIGNHDDQSLADVQNATEGNHDDQSLADVQNATEGNHDDQSLATDIKVDPIYNLGDPSTSFTYQ